MKRRDRTVRPAAGDAAAYPRRREVFDPSRRRFLRQLAVGSAAAGCCGGVAVGSARRARADERPVDFSVLEEHDPAVVIEPEARREAPADVDTAAGLSRVRATSSYIPPEPEPEPEPEPGPVTYIEENRAMWLEPGYLVLVRWERPEGDDDIIAAFEGAHGAVQSHLQAVITDPARQLHDAAQVRPFEESVTALLAPLLAPARIVALHLDHDCAELCGFGAEETVPTVRGRIAPVRP